MKQFNLILVLWLCVSNQVSADWQDWWRTPEQQARAAFDEGDNEQLIRLAPDAAWQGVAEHESADYESAAETFDKVVTQQDLAGNTQEATRALYNRAVSEVRLGEYQKAVESFDQVLERNPEFADAQFNREIARQLVQQQEQQQSPSQPQAGDESDDDNDSESQDSSEQQNSSSDDEQSQSGEQQQSDSQASEGSEQAESGGEQGGEQGDDSETSEAQSEAEQSRDQQAARDALDAEAQQGADDENQSDQDGFPNAAQNAEQREEPLTESEQATEQWLRRIPDDPAGLLRRKLEQSHRIEYPEVRNAQEPW